MNTESPAASTLALLFHMSCSTFDNPVDIHRACRIRGNWIGSGVIRIILTIVIRIIIIKVFWLNRTRWLIIRIDWLLAPESSPPARRAAVPWQAFTRWYRTFALRRTLFRAPVFFLPVMPVCVVITAHRSCVLIWPRWFPVPPNVVVWIDISVQILEVAFID